MGLIKTEKFSHLGLQVSKMEPSLEFYRDALGLEVVFDINLDGPSLDAMTGTPGSKGRMVGLLAGNSIIVELMEGVAPDRTDGSSDSVNFALSVIDITDAHRKLIDGGITPLHEPVDIGGVKMFFVADPDGRKVELAEYPGNTNSNAEMHGR